MNIDLLLDHPASVPGRPLTLRALARITGRAPAESRRTPLNLALVLDRSGSMGGDKLEHAKDAAALLVRRVWPDDTVGVVVYDDQVETLIAGATGERHSEAEARIRGLFTGGMTNLSGGWLRGRDLALDAFREAGVNRVILMTDGLANQGITDRDSLAGLPAEARARGITTTTIGFGRDFDEDLLRAMADAGGGAAYYIENPDQAPGIFEEEVEGLLSLAAQNVTLEVAPREGVRGVAVRHSYPSTPVGRGLRLDIGDLYAREPRLALMQFILEDARPGTELAVADLRVSGHVLTEEGGVEHRVVELPVRLAVGEGPRVEAEVRRVAVLLDAAEARERAERRRMEGDFGGAGEVLRESAGQLVQSLPGDPEAAREAAELSDLASRLEEERFYEEDVKYMKQRSYDAMRSKMMASDRYRRE
jgi:Ca-activated chloride channel homolog